MEVALLGCGLMSLARWPLQNSGCLRQRQCCRTGDSFLGYLDMIGLAFRCGFKEATLERSASFQRMLRCGTLSR
jgi:hypothetical protein